MYCGGCYGVNFESDMNCSSWSHSGFGEKWGNGTVSVKPSSALDDEKGELVKASWKLGKKIDIMETKAVAALKSHSEAERRRRERINAHLETLRSLVPSSEKMDKATLLAEVISQVKQLKLTAARASEGLAIPMDTDAIDIAILEGNVCGSFLLKASLCCNYTPDLLSNVKEAINGLPVRVLRSEISTFGGRVKSMYLITIHDRNNDSIHAIPQEQIVSTLRGVLTNILDKVSAVAEYDQLVFPRKRQRLSHCDPSFSSL